MATKQKDQKDSGSKKAAPTITPRDIAEELDVTPLQFRVFLRSQDLGVGRGKRYKFTKKEAAKLKKAYIAAHPDQFEDDTDDE